MYIFRFFYSWYNLVRKFASWVKNNEKINWRFFLKLMTQRFKFLVYQDNNTIYEAEKKVKQIKALIFDDSPYEKTGKHIEGVGYIHDHVKNMYILGFKLLVCGFYDGSSFIPIDFSFHSENGDKKLKNIEIQLNNKQNKLKIITKQIDNLREKKKINKKELDKCRSDYNKKPGKTRKIILERKERVKNSITKRLREKNKEKNDLKTKISELEAKQFDLKSTHCGLSKKQYKEQFKKKRSRNTAGYRRKQELNKNKLDITIKMLKRAVRNGFLPDYVLTDSWFFCKKLLDAVIETGRSLHLVSMAKIGIAKYRVLPDDKLLNPHEIIKRYERKNGHYSRKYKANYIQLQAEYQGIRVKIFLIKFGSHAKWRMLVTTDLRMSFTRIIEVYQIRWTIEVFFKECKQHLLLGKCQSRYFDAHIADTTLVFTRYIFLSYYERTHYGTTIGGVFRELTQNSIKENLLADISFYFIKLLQIFANYAGIDFFTFYEDLIRKPETNEILLKIGISTDKQAA